MAWLKGVRTDGFIKIDENVNFRGTVVGTGDGNMRPYGALDYYVDGTDGDDSYSGKSWEGAFATIQAAVTAQIADTNAKGDNIWIAPGTYAETITGNLTKVKLMGAGRNMVIIAPTDSNAYAGDINDSVVSGITFRTPSTSSKTYAALAAGELIGSLITDCGFDGTTDPTSVAVGTVGLRIGDETDGTWEQMLNSSVVGNRFYHTGGRNNVLSVAINFGNIDDTDNNATRCFRNSLIADNMIAAEFYGINLNTGNSNNNGGVIAGNWIHSVKGGFGSVGHGIYHAASIGTDILAVIADNRVNAAVDGILGFHTANVQGNIVSIGGAAPASETGQGS